MRLKQDAIPGMEIPIYFTATMSSDEYLEFLKINLRVKNNEIKLNILKMKKYFNKYNY